jgi:mannose-1-phosphate guanylyltransferase
MKIENLCVLIMAGGIGTRFWPKSTEEKPKQFINLLEDRTMIQITVDRIKNILPIEKIFVSTGEKYISLVKEQLPDLPDKNIVVEPIGRNTAPCILLSTLYIKQLYGNCNIAVLPSDHLIQNTEIFLETLGKANAFVENTNKAIVTIGITPDRPETGYGYIKFNKEDKNEVVKVDRFVEKPNLEKAEQYLESKEYLWNAGMFIFNADYMLSELAKNYTKTYELFKTLPLVEDAEYYTKLNEVYPQSESISIDYAVMEKSEHIYVIPADFGWDDIGTWKALERYIEPDSASNIVKGNAKFYNATNNVVYAGDKKVVLLDVDNVFFIESDEMIVVGKKENLKDLPQYRNK